MAAAVCSMRDALYSLCAGSRGTVGLVRFHRFVHQWREYWPMAAFSGTLWPWGRSGDCCGAGPGKFQLSIAHAGASLRLHARAVQCPRGAAYCGRCAYGPSGAPVFTPRATYPVLSDLEYATRALSFHQRRHDYRGLAVRSALYAADP
jgi:hypothetical protein